MKKLLLIHILFVAAGAYSQVHTLKESIYFGIGKTSLTKSHKSKLDSIIVLLKSSKSYVGEVKGFTCNIGSSRINKVISNLRALNVLNYLVDRGIKKENFTYNSFGFNHPNGNKKSPQERALNRRTDVEVVLNLFDETVNYKEEENKTTSESSGTIVSNSTSKSTPSAPPVEIGPDFSSGKIPKAGNKIIKTTNRIVLEVDKNSLVSGSSEPIDLDFKDYTQNYDIIKKGFNTASGGCKNLSLIGAFSVSFTQEYQELSMNSQKPIIVSIPSEYFPNAKLFSNPKKWTADTINRLSYNYEKKAYEVSIINNTNVIGIFNDAPDTIVFLRIKMKGLSPELIKPYVIYDNCNISSCCKQNGKWFIVPISTKSSNYKIRSSYTDFSSKNGDSYSMNYDIKDLDITKLKVYLKEGNVIIYKYPEKLKITNQRLDKSNLCDQVITAN